MPPARAHTNQGRTRAATSAHFKLQDPELQELILILRILDIMFQASFLSFHLFYLQNKEHWLQCHSRSTCLDHARETRAQREQGHVAPVMGNGGSSPEPPSLVTWTLYGLTGVARKHVSDNREGQKPLLLAGLYISSYYTLIISIRAVWYRLKYCTFCIP